MNRESAMILGANHQFLYLAGMSDADVHTDTLKRLADDSRIEALDCWVWAHEPNRSRELDILRHAGKVVNYNIGDRFGEPAALYAARAPQAQAHAQRIFWRELDQALQAGARKIVMGSGPDFPDEREHALQRLEAFVCAALDHIGPEASLVIEPTDRELDKRFLLGPLRETVALVRAVRARGHHNMGILLDMGHIPLLGETIEGAVGGCEQLIEHVHLGNALICDTSDPLYGDKHVAWDTTKGEYGQPEVNRMIAALRQAGYFERAQRASVSFEMRPMQGLGAEQSLGRFIEMLDTAWAAG